MPGNVIILTGPPGAGKSTIARRIASLRVSGVHLHTDDYWSAIIAGGIPAYLPEADEQNQTVLRAIAAAAFEFANGGFDVVVDGIVGPWMLHHFAEARRVHPSVDVSYTVLRPDRAVTLSRAIARTSPDALIDPDPVLAMWDQFAHLGALERHVLETSDEDADTTVVRVTQVLAAGEHLLSHSPEG